MKSFFKLFLVLISVLLFFTTSFAKECYQTEIIFEADGWDQTIPSGQTAKFSTDASPQELHLDFNQSGTNQSKLSHACFGLTEQGGTYVAGTIYSQNAPVKVYVSVNSYDSSQRAITLRFPADFRQIQKK